LYPGSYQPSGHVNISRAREFYFLFNSATIGTVVPSVDLVVVAIAINFLLISDGKPVPSTARHGVARLHLILITLSIESVIRIETHETHETNKIMNMWCCYWLVSFRIGSTLFCIYAEEKDGSIRGQICENGQR
jgi:hypothetical protein